VRPGAGREDRRREASAAGNPVRRRLPLFHAARRDGPRGRQGHADARLPSEKAPDEDGARHRREGGVMDEDHGAGWTVFLVILACWCAIGILVCAAWWLTLFAIDLIRAAT